MKTKNGFVVVVGQQASSKSEAELSYDNSQVLENGEKAGRMAKFVHFVEEWTNRKGGRTERRWRAFFAKQGQEETGPYFVRREDNFRLTNW